jgi:hypothetical protein
MEGESIDATFLFLGLWVLTTVPNSHRVGWVDPPAGGDSEVRRALPVDVTSGIHGTNQNDWAYFTGRLITSNRQPLIKKLISNCHTAAPHGSRQFLNLNSQYN